GLRVGQPYVPPSTPSTPSAAAGHDLSEEGLARRGLAMLTGMSAVAQAGEASGVLRTLKRQRRKLERKRDAIAADATRAQRVDTLRAEAGLLLSHLQHHQPGAHCLTVPDEAGPDAGRVIQIDPALGPKQ